MKKGVILLICFIIALVGLGIYSNYEKSHPRVITQTKQPPRMPEQDEAYQFIASRPSPSTLFTNRDIDTNNLDVVQNFSRASISRIENSLTIYSNIPEVKQMKSEFSGKLYVSMFSQNMGATSYLTKDFEEAKKYGDPHYQEVAFYSIESKNDPHLAQALLFYKPDWRALVLPGIKIDEPWFSALVIHEMYHSYLQRHNLSSGNAASNSDAYIKEELAAHQLEEKVLDQATKGRYSKVIDSVVSSLSGLRDEDNIKSSLTTAQLESIDQLFPKGSVDETNSRTAEYIFSIAMKWLALRYDGDALVKKQIDFYRTFSEQ